MNKAWLDELFALRNRYGVDAARKKTELLHKLSIVSFKKGDELRKYNDVLLFLMAFPDNKSVYDIASKNLQKLQAYIKADEVIKWRLFNSGVTGSSICGAFGFDLVKWLRGKYKHHVTLDSIGADDSQITYILSAVMPQVESEILQDANANWKQWIKRITPRGNDLLDSLIAIFNESEIRPEVKDELWSALGIYVTVELTTHTTAPASVAPVYYHRSLIAKASLKNDFKKPERIKLSDAEAETVLACGRMVLVRFIREMDPITFSAPQLISYYQLQRGYCIALYHMTTNRRHPVDSYLAYVAFKNGLPVSYGGSWVLFDSSRIALNVFYPYRGGESMHIFEQVLQLHKEVLQLKRFSVDPYQIGKDNSDGIHSGAFWVYYKLGFRPIRQKQHAVAEAEARKMHADKKHRSSTKILKHLAESKLEMVLSGNPVRFDAADLSIVYAAIVAKHYNHNRQLAEKKSCTELLRLVKLGKATTDENMAYVLKNWSVFLMRRADMIRTDKTLRDTLKQAFRLKANGNEEQYIRVLQRSTAFRKLVQSVVEEYLN